MDAQLNERFEAIDQRFEGVDQRFEAIDQRFDRLEGKVDALDSRFDALSSSFDQGFADVDRQFVAVRLEMAEHADGIKRHFDVVAENLVSKIELGFEGITGLADRMDRVQENCREGDARLARELRAEMGAMNDTTQQRLDGLESRVDRLETADDQPRRDDD